MANPNIVNVTDITAKYATVTPANTSDTDILPTVGTNAVGKVLSLYATNIGAVAAKATVKIGVGASQVILVNALSVSPNQVQVLIDGSTKVNVPATYKIQVATDTASGLAFHCSWDEVVGLAS